MLRTLVAALGMLPAFLLPASLSAAVGPESTLVVVNGDSPASLAVANAWVDLRDIPRDHVVVLHGVPTDTYSHRAEFVATVLNPLRAAVRGRGLGDDIELIAYAPDFPLQVCNDLVEPPPRQIGWFGSLTGMTALGGLVLDGDGEWTFLRANRSYTLPGGVVEQPLVPPELVKAFQGVAVDFKAGNYAAAEAKLLDLDRQVPRSADVLYDLACAQARLHHDDAAVTSLEHAVDAGFNDGKWIAQDDDLESLHGEPRFEGLLARLKAFHITAPETQPLDGHAAWLGEEHPQRRDHGLVPTVLLGQCSGDGLSIPATIAGLARAAGADGTHPTGTIYCEKNGDVRSTTRAWAFDALKQALDDEHIAAVVENGILPQHRPAVAGAVIGISDFDWAKSGSTIVPGAICEHLTSLGGQMWPGASQTHVSAWLRAGAAGSSGTVDEPLAIQAKFPTPFIQSHYVRGLTLVEAFYRAVEAPYQLLIVGDPLCAPWARPVAMAGADDAHVPGGDGIRMVEVWLDGHRFDTEAPGAALPTFDHLSAGVHELRLVCLPTEAHAQPARVVRTFTVDGAVPQVTAPATVALDGIVQIQAVFPGPAHLRLHADGGTVAEIAGASGTLSVAADRLGLGPVVLDVEAVADDAVIARTRVRVAITPAAPLPALPWPSIRIPHPQVTVDGRNRIITSACEGDAWLHETGINRQGGTVEAWFRSDGGLWQAQWLGKRVTAIAIDGEGPIVCGDSHWLLRTLAAGWHRVRFVVAPGTGECALRIGSEGTWPLSAKNCCHAWTGRESPFPLGGQQAGE